MRLWGRWHQPDISAQLAAVGPRPGSAKGVDSSARPAASTRPRPFGLDAHSWLRACGLACGYGDCEEHGQGSGARPRLRLCAEWLHRTTWRVSPLRAWVRGQQGKREREGREAEGERHAPLAQASRRKDDLDADLGSYLGSDLGADLEAQIRREAWAAVAMPADLAEAASRAAARHPAALVAFRRPLVVADRREYQLYVHLLHSAAMLCGRRPVLPLAHCNRAGEWGEFARCSFVMRAAGTNEPYCVMRPPSPCIDRVALPSAIPEVPAGQRVVVRLPQLPLRDGKVDGAAFARALADAGGTEKQLMLLDIEALTSADDVTSLLLSPKGWLCTAEHKSCQFTCV